MTGSGDSGGSRDDEPAWHERTSTVVGASAAAVAVLGLLWLLISYMTGGSDDPAGTSQYYPDASTSGRSTTPTSTTSTTNTETITSTSPPDTTDINPGDTTTTSSTDTSSTDTSSSETTTTRTRRPTTNDDGQTTTRQRPRLNETRTLYPRP